jgi:gliding motility-associated peptidyl-prolyl isomerase
MKKCLFSLVGILLLFSCKSPEPRRPVTQESGSYIDESVARNRKIVALEEERIAEIIKQDTLNEYHSSPNGFWYFYVEKDSVAGKTPDFGDVVEFDYDLKTIDGRTIYSEEELPTMTYTMDKEKLFSGLRQGLKLMQEGETVTFLFPSHKAFGYYGDTKRIGSDVPVISTVTLNKIISEISNPNN